MGSGSALEPPQATSTISLYIIGRTWHPILSSFGKTYFRKCGYTSQNGARIGRRRSDIEIKLSRITINGGCELSPAISSKNG
jgi:hypothetical protein